METQNIDTMEAGREIDALIAEKVMGKPSLCRLIGDGISDPLRLDIPGAIWRERSPADRYWERFSPDGSERVINDFGVPYYSTDIAAAWEVVQKMQADGHCLEVRPYVKVSSGFRVAIWEGRDLDYATGETAPLAICRAALKALYLYAAAA